MIETVRHWLVLYPRAGWALFVVGFLFTVDVTFLCVYWFLPIKFTGRNGHEPRVPNPLHLHKH